MSIPGSASPLFFGAGAADAAAFQIDRSLRFNSADSAYLNRTPSSAGNRKTWTWSGWVKRSALGSQKLFIAGSSGTEGGIQFHSGTDNMGIRFYDYQSGAHTIQLDTDQLFRDVAGWYHIVGAIDTTQATASDRAKLYINGVQVTSFATATYPSQNLDTLVNNNIAHYLGWVSPSGNYFNGYLADVHFIDGQALAPTDFGEFDSNNVWQPKDTSGLTFGTNGFRLTFADNSSNAALGTDSSGAGNNWSVNNISAAGSAWNQSQTWSSGLSALSGSLTNPPNGFDGDVDSYADSTAGFSLDLSGHTFGTGSHSIEVKSGGATSFSVNGSTSLSDPGGGGAKVWTGTHTGEITSIASSATGASVYYVKIDNLFLVNAGVVDTAASEIDSLIDTPTNYTAASGNNNGGNYATLNPLITATTTTLSNGNLDMNGYNGSSSLYGTIGISSGKYYWETIFPDTGAMTGVAATPNGSQYPGGASDAYAIDKDNKYNNNSASSFHAFAAGSVVGCAFDADNGTLTFYDDGVSAGTAFTSIPAGTYFPIFRNGSSTNVSVNFGQRSFAYTPPSNHLALVTTNLPDPTIADGSTAFDTVLYSGDGQTTQTVALPFAPGLVWQKKRSHVSAHYLLDAVRGFANDKALASHSTEAEGVNSAFFTFSQSGSNITVGDYGTNTGNEWNTSGRTYAIWTWEAGTSTVSNTDGTITSQVRASQTNGISIVSYTGNGNNSQTVGHGLNAVPEWVIYKRRGAGDNWKVYHHTQTATKLSNLNGTNAFTSNNDIGTAPTSSVISVSSSDSTYLNDSTNGTYLALCWAPVEGYSAFGSYTGNGQHNNDLGPFIYTGFRPAFVIFKRTDNTGAWEMYDSTRSPANPYKLALVANTNGAEYNVGSYPADMLSNGFKIRHSGSNVNASGGTYIYMAFAEHPFKTARAR